MTINHRRLYILELIPKRTLYKNTLFLSFNLTSYPLLKLLIKLSFFGE